MSHRIAVLGATGLVGRTMLQVLEERSIPIREMRLLASDRAESRTIAFQGRPLAVHPASEAGLADLDLALFACDNAVSERWAPVARAAGARVVDNSSAFRYRPEVPLVIPEVNGTLLASRPDLVANPNCSAIALILSLAPLTRAAGLERVEVSTYQSISGAGGEALEELERGLKRGLEGAPPPRSDGGPPYALNVVPHVDRFEENGYTREEMKVIWETRKILELPELAVTVTAVRVPVRVGHCAAVTVRLARELEPEAARELWKTTPGVVVVDDPSQGRYPTPLEAAGSDEVLVGRVRRDVSQPRGLAYFIASDNLRKGAATNAVQIAEQLLAPTAGAVTPSP